MPSESGSAWSPPASTSERRLSNSSDGSAGSSYSKATTDSADFLATRPHTAGVLPGKPAGNPLQFIRVGPADLGSRAREQLRRAELAKRTDPAKIERQEEWQSNLDNWKSSRRKRVEHIIERCVEVRRMEHEPGQHRGKSKTFNEMLEERAGRRRPSRNHLALFTEDDAHDLSDLGIGTSSTKSSLSEDCDTHSLASDGMDLDKNHSDIDNHSHFEVNRKLGSSANEYDTCTTTTISSPEPEEYTYEGAIEGYKSRIISNTNSNIVKTVVNTNFKEKSPENQNGDLNRIRTNVSNKIEEKVSSFQQERGSDAKNNNQKKDLPKVDIHKRREQFERENSQDLQTNKPKIPDITNKKSIKERLSSLEKFTEETQKCTTDLNKLSSEVKPLKERLSSLEKVKAASNEPEKVKRLSNGDLSNTKSLKERLSSLKSQTSEEDTKIVKMEAKEVSVSLRERLSCLDAAKNKEIPKISVEDEIAYNKPETKESKINDDLSETNLKCTLSGIESQMQSFCHSFDSLDINGQTSPSSFERVQSLEDFDCAEMQNNTVPSDIETEDSGIHTARDSCAPADDIADLTQVASPIGEPMNENPEYESSNEDGVILEHKKIEDHIYKSNEPINTVIEKTVFEEIDEQDSKAEDTDSASNYIQALSRPEDLSVTEELTEIQMDKEDEDTLKSLDNPDTSVSLNEPVSSSSEGDTVVFEGKMTIHLNLTEICSNMNAGAGSNTNAVESSLTNVTTNTKSMPMVTVSNIITTSNISPKNSIKTLRTFNDSNSSLTNKFVDVTCSSKNQTYNNDPYNRALPDRHVSNETKEINQNRDIITANSEEVIDALEIAFKELDSEDSFATNMDDSKLIPEDKVSDMKGQNNAFNVDGKIDVTPLYENIEIFYQNSSDSAAAFPLDLPTNVLEPPKEKPPPPPVEDVPEDELGNGDFKHTSSARRIKKEIRNKRTSFLGIEGQDDSYLDAEKLAPRPDITSFLQEETKIEKLLYKKTLSHDDSNLRESRDSGVDIDRGPSAEAWYKGNSSPDTSNPHSRQNSEPYTHVTVTSDEEEAAKKQTEKFSNHLTSKLTELDTFPQNDHKIDHLEKKLKDQQEVLRFERELLQLEQEELRRQRHNLMRDQNRIIQKSVQDVSIITPPEKPVLVAPKPDTNYRHSMPNLLVNESYTVARAAAERPVYIESTKRKPFVSEEHIQKHFGVEESRKVLYDETKISEAIRRPVPNLRPQPILPPKPKSRESIEREITMRSSRVPSAGEFGNVERPTPLLKPQLNGNAAYHPMTRHTLQALSAAPTPKLITNAEWMQPRTRKPQQNFNYNQHWLIQEAEQRRIEEQRNKIRAMQRHSYHQDLHGPMHQLQQMQNLSASHQHLVPEYKRPLRPEAGPKTEPLKEDKLLSVSGRRKCSHCGEELGRGAAMVIESLGLCYHVWCFACAVCGARLGDGRAGADVRVRAGRLHCHHCYSSDDGHKYSCV